MPEENRTGVMPPLTMFWFLPVSGDGPYLASTEGRRPADHEYLREVALAIDRLGYGGALLPTGLDCEDGWIAAAGMAAVTRRMKFLVALRPAVTSPTFAARQSAALDRLSEGRLLLNVVCGSSPVELAADGVYLAHDERYAQGAEFVHIWRRLMQGETVTYKGRYFDIQKAYLGFLPVQQPYPELWLGGSSDPAKDLSADQIDLYLTYCEPVAQVAEKIASVRERAARHGRKLRFGLRLHFIVRETDEEAWAAAERLISKVSDEAIAAAKARFTQNFDSIGQRRMIDLHGYRRDRLEIAPNLWAGIGLVRTGNSTALVGSAKIVAERLREYQAVGIDTVIGSGYPHLEEAYRVAELLFPELGVGATGSALREKPSSEFDPGRAAIAEAAG